MTDQLFTGPHSTWEAEAKALREKNLILRTNAHADAECIGNLDRRVAKLEAALRDVIGMSDEIAKAPMTADRWADRIEDIASAALGDTQ